MRLLILATLLLGCPAADECAPVCSAAGDLYAGCLTEWGQDWGAAVGYADRADWDNWCDTVQAEDRLLADTSAADDAEDQRQARCANQLDVADRGACDEYGSMWDGDEQ